MWFGEQTKAADLPISESEKKRMVGAAQRGGAERASQRQQTDLKINFKVRTNLVNWTGAF